MTSTSQKYVEIHVKFLGEASLVYGENGLEQATSTSVGFDLRACHEGEAVSIPPGERRMIPVGIVIEPRTPGIAGFVYSRSGLGGIKGLTVAQGVGIIDPDYRGEIKVPLLNTGKEEYLVQRGDRIAQIVFQPYFSPVFTQVEELGETGRGHGGFGHSGR